MHSKAHLLTSACGEGKTAFTEGDQRRRGPSIGSVVKNLPVNAGDPGLIPGEGRSTGEENGCPL